MNNTPAQTDYWTGLDGLRFLAFLLVFIHHAPEPSWGWMKVLRDYGWIGVEIFFAISGFLLFSLLQREWDKTGDIKVGSFYRRRFLRIYPLMLLLPIIAAYIFWPLPGIWQARFAAIALCLDNVAIWARGYNLDIPSTAHLWTLSYEFQIYAVLPFAFLLARRMTPQQFLISLILVEAFVLCARATFIGLGVRHPIIWVTPFLRPESTLAGIAIAAFAPRIPSPLAALALVVSFALVVTHQNVGAIGTWTIAMYVLTGIFSASALLLAIRCAPVVRVLSTPVLRFLGTISFGLYVYHALMLFYSGRLYAYGYWPRSLAALGATIIVATISYYAFERPIMRSFRPRLDGDSVPLPLLDRLRLLFNLRSVPR